MEDKIKQRITQLPVGKEIISGSTPVISFGDFTKASFVTIGINPSSLEFLKGGKDRQLLGDMRRFEDWDSLELQGQDSVPEEMAERVWKGCQKYFADDHNPYWQWFGALESVLRMIGGSYTRSAAHIDLVQWATDPAWRSIPKSNQEAYLSQDLDFFKWQLQQPNISIRLVNGNTVMKAMKKYAGYTFKKDLVLRLQKTGRTERCHVYIGHGPNGEVALAWSTNIQAIKGLAEYRESAARQIGEWASSVIRSYLD